MKQTLLLLFLFTTTIFYSQDNFTLSGTIKDATNGESIFGGSVFLKNTSIGTLTNEYGFFSLSAPEGKYTLVISFIGYKRYEQEVTLDESQKFDIELEVDTAELNEVVIVAEETEKASLKSPQMGVNKLKAETIKQIPVVLGEVDVVKSLQLLPGVTNNGEGSSGFNVRGGAADQNLILLDEAVIYNASHLFGFFSVFNADVVKDIKLYKGSIPPNFGGRVSSVLDIRQKDGNSKDYEFTGGIGAVSSRLAAEGPIFGEKGSFILAGRGSYAHLFLKITDNENSAYFYDANLKTNYQFNDNNRVYLSGYFGRDVFDLNGIVNTSYGNATGNLRWNHIFNDKLFSNLSLIYSKYDYQLNLDFIELDWKSDIENYHLKYDFSYFLNNKINLDFGLEAIRYDFNPGEVKPSTTTSPINYRQLQEKQALESAFYMNSEHKITSKFTAQYGFRLSRFDRFGEEKINIYTNDQPVVYNPTLGIYEEGTITGEEVYDNGESIADFTKFEPRLSLAYQYSEKASVKASYARTAQYIHLISNTITATPLDIWAPSGKYIKPQLAHQYAIGYFRELEEGKYSLETEAYYKTVDNRLDYVDGAELIANENIETEILSGEAKAYGLEVLFRKNKGKLTGWLAYTLSKSEQRAFGGNAGGLGINEGNWYLTPYDRTHDISLTTSYQLNEKWSFSANGIFQTGRPVTYPNSQYLYEGFSVANFASRNENRLPAYHRVDVSATLKPQKAKKWKGEWVFSIYNVYNRKNAASITFGQNRETGNNEATRTAIFGIVPSVTYNFKF
ncbi:TonB-dependent receptor [Mesonia sp. K7]|uniref:TonB-dependent receptor n=1 Tax=Mesonia sp. K7 TaxID=2218606 RepID=UPI000DAAAD92|nr:TonB-dependent receptor [Mesonia sp. K7]PZD79127.1 hypothetical protein DNG35_03720 [Mesonia sp. K7]